MFVLPSLELDERIDGGTLILAPSTDKEVVELADMHERFRSFLGRFSDAFGVPIRPSVLMMRDTAPATFRTLEALAGFRDAVALSTITNSRALHLIYPQSQKVLFSDCFEFYPWMLDKDYKDLIASTQIMHALHEVKKFHGQCTPGFPPVKLRIESIDMPLLEALIAGNQRLHGSQPENWRDMALFRSLNMAYHASQMPSKIGGLFYDVGRQIALWVSAFEILVNPGKEGRASLAEVIKLLEQVPWCDKGLASALYCGYGPKPRNHTLAGWLYETVHHRRNAFLHGNPVTPDFLQVPGYEAKLFSYIPILYRLALTAFFPLTTCIQEIASSESSELERKALERERLLRPQRALEKALLTAVSSKSAA